MRVWASITVQSPRPESRAKIGEQVDAQTLLADLRQNPGVDKARGLPGDSFALSTPGGPNSGLSVELLL